MRPLPDRQVAVLTAIAKAGGYLGTREVRYATGLTASQVSAACTSLRKKALLEVAGVYYDADMIGLPVEVPICHEAYVYLMGAGPEDLAYAYDIPIGGHVYAFAGAWQPGKEVKVVRRPDAPSLRRTRELAREDLAAMKAVVRRCDPDAGKP